MGGAGQLLQSWRGSPARHKMSHRSYQPTQSCGSKLLQQKWDKTYYDEHRRMVKSAKPMVDTRQPEKRPHVTAKWKKQQVERERTEEVERDNKTLLLKMQTIMKTHGTVDHRNSYTTHHSLNGQKRQREMERVAAENKAMLQRLQRVKPMYRISDWIDDWRRSEELAERITAYPTATHLSSKAKTLPSRSVTASKTERMASTSVGGTQSRTERDREEGETGGEAGGNNGTQDTDRDRGGREGEGAAEEMS